MKTKLISQLKAGDVVRFHGHRLLVTTDAYSTYEGSFAYGHAIDFVGPSATTCAQSKPIEATQDPYFRNGWTFQGNFNHLGVYVE